MDKEMRMFYTALIVTILCLALFWFSDAHIAGKLVITAIAGIGRFLFWTRGFSAVGVSGLVTSIVIDIGLITYLKATDNWIFD